MQRIGSDVPRLGRACRGLGLAWSKSPSPRLSNSVPASAATNTQRPRAFCTSSADRSVESRGVTPRQVQLGSDESWLFPSESLQQLDACNELIGNPQALRDELSEKGYLFVRGLHDRQAVLQARLAVLHHIADVNASALDVQNHDWQEGVLMSRCGAGCVPFMEGRNSITHSDDVLQVLEGKRAREFFGSLFDQPALTFDFKWLRAMHSSGFTGAHVDNVYMSRGTSKLLTCWQPLGDVTVDMGTLAVCEGSHRLPAFDKFQQTYGNCDVEKANLQGTGWFTVDPKDILQIGGQWRTSDFQAGDALIFTTRTVHMSTANQTHFARVSCDTRWQPASEPADHRYVGNTVGHTDAKFGVYAAESANDKGQQEVVTMEKMRAQWGL